MMKLGERLTHDKLKGVFNLNCCAKDYNHKQEHWSWQKLNAAYYSSVACVLKVWNFCFGFWKMFFLFSHVGFCCDESFPPTDLS